LPSAKHTRALLGGTKLRVATGHETDVLGEPCPGVEHGKLRSSRTQRVRLVLAADFDELFPHLGEDGARHQTPLDVAPRAPRGLQTTTDDDFFVELQIVPLEYGPQPRARIAARHELSFDESGRRTVPDARAAALRPAQELECIDDH
jgi:hypothetical protein